MSNDTEFLLKSILNFMVTLAVISNTLLLAFLLWITDSVGAFMVMRISFVLMCFIVGWFMFRLGKNTWYYYFA